MKTKVEEVNNESESFLNFYSKELKIMEQAIEDELTWEQKELAYQMRIEDLEIENARLRRKLNEQALSMRSVRQTSRPPSYEEY